MNYMGLAVGLALKSKPFPNPKVGCVIVRENQVVGKGFHKVFGGNHAEIIALNDAGEKAKNADMYVTLEPCCSFGKTPPCTDAIIKSGIKKVVIGSLDPNPLNRRGAEILKKNNIEVEVADCAEAKKLNEFFSKFILKKIPFVAIKTAVSLDGKISLDNGESRWITNEKSRKKTHELRDEYQAIMTSANTVINDNPMLDARIENGRDPVRIILDSRLRAPLNSNVFKDRNVIVATTKNADKSRLEHFRQKEIETLIVKDKDGRIDLKDLMKVLAEKGISNIFVETGPTLNTALIKEKLVDKFYFFIAPKILGGSKSTVADLHFSSMKEIIELKDLKIEMFGNDLMFEGYI